MIKLGIFINKVESEGIGNVDTIKQEIEAGNLGSNNMDKDKVKPYHEIIANKIEKENIIANATMVNTQ